MTAPTLPPEGAEPAGGAIGLNTEEPVGACVGNGVAKPLVTCCRGSAIIVGVLYI